MAPHMAVFADNPQDPVSNLQLIKRVEAAQPSLAVKMAVEADDTTPDPEMCDGAEFMVMTDLSEPMEFVTYEYPGETTEA